MGFDYRKFKNLVHYICYKADHNELGATKLNKILWFSDVQRYIESGKSITGEIYKKDQYGPIPSHVLPALDELAKEQKIYPRDVRYYGFPKKEFITLTKPDLGCFSAEEISLVDSMIHAICCGHTAVSISEFTHDDGWKLAERGEELPYYTIFVGEDLEVTQEDIDWAHQSIAENCGL